MSRHNNPVHTLQIRQKTHPSARALTGLAGWRSNRPLSEPPPVTCRSAGPLDYITLLGHGLRAIATSILMAASRVPRLHRTLGLITRPLAPPLRLSNARALSTKLQALERTHTPCQRFDSLSTQVFPCIQTCSKLSSTRLPSRTVFGYVAS